MAVAAVICLNMLDLPVVLSPERLGIAGDGGDGGDE